MVRKRRAEFVPALVSFACLAGTQLLFWTFTFPANQRTAKWTVLPEGWMALRAQWEYSHAASALLNLAALIALIVACCGPSVSPRRSDRGAGGHPRASGRHLAHG